MPVLFGVVLLDLIGFGIVIPILPFLSPELGADKLDVCLLYTSDAADDDTIVLLSVGGGGV